MDASRRLLSAAECVAQVYGDDPQLAATMVSGSAARGWADKWSDVEVGLFWHVVPAGEALSLFAARLNAENVAFSRKIPILGRRMKNSCLMA